MKICLTEKKRDNGNNGQRIYHAHIHNISWPVTAFASVIVNEACGTFQAE